MGVTSIPEPDTYVTKVSSKFQLALGEIKLLVNITVWVISIVPPSVIIILQQQFRGLTRRLLFSLILQRQWSLPKPSRRIGTDNSYRFRVGFFYFQIYDQMDESLLGQSYWRYFALSTRRGSPSILWRQFSIWHIDRESIGMFSDRFS